jgi:hypothetical protein
MAKTETKTATTTDSKLVIDFKAERRVSTPIVAVETADPAATIETLMSALKADAPVVSWDCVRGLRGLNKIGSDTLAQRSITGDATANPVEALLQIERLPEFSAIFFHAANYFIGNDPQVRQAIWNLRDTFKTNRRTLILLDVSFQLPAQLQGDVTLLNELLPTRAELNAILDQQHVNAELPLPNDEVRAAALDALVGLPKFTSEQVVASSLTKNGMDVPKCWNRKISAIEATPGLQVWKGGGSFDDLKGIDNVRDSMQEMIDSDSFGAVVFIDEGDKAMSGGMAEHVGDGGVSKDQVGQLLSYIEDTKSPGVMFAGLAGCGKTELAKSVAAKAGKVCIVFDLGGMKGGHVGESERQIRNALKVVTATAEGRVLFIMTANKTTLFSPEINRRFPDQFFFDLPDAAACKAIGDVYIAKNNLRADQVADLPWKDGGWTGAEIKRACERAARYNKTVREGARYIVPMAISAASTIAEMRANATGRFLSASTPGLYQTPVPVAAPEVVKAKQQRTIEIE